MKRIVLSIFAVILYAMATYQGVNALEETFTPAKDYSIPFRDKSIIVQKGTVSEAEYVFTEPGVFEYYCPTGNLKGSLTVLERPHQNRRKIASENEIKSENIRVWMPRED